MKTRLKQSVAVILFADCNNKAVCIHQILYDINAPFYFMNEAVICRGIFSFTLILALCPNCLNRFT